MSTRMFASLFMSVAVTGAVGWWWQWQRVASGRTQFAAVAADVEVLRNDHQRLRAAQISETELDGLRSDRAAVQRLREEVKTLRLSVEAREQALADETARRKIPRPARPVPDLVVRMEWSPEAGILLDGKPVTDSDLRTRVAPLSAGRMFEIRVPQPKPGDRDAVRVFGERVKALSNTARDVAKQQGLKLSIRFEKTD